MKKNNCIGKALREEAPFFLLTIPLAWQFFFILLPFCLLIGYSFFSPKMVFTLEYWSSAINVAYCLIIMRSLFIAVITSFLSFCLAFPFSYLLTFFFSPDKAYLLIFLLILPSWTSFIVQVYSWFYLLGKQSFLGILLQSIGLGSLAGAALNNYFGIILVMVFVYLPFMILPIYAVMEKIDKMLLEVSADLGARRLETIRRIILPLSMPGVIMGFVLVLLPAFGEFAIPAIIGGSRKVFWGDLMADQFLKYYNWQLGSVYTLLAIIVPASFMLFLVMIFRKSSILPRKKSGVMR